MGESNEVIEWKFPRVLRNYVLAILIIMPILFGGFLWDAYFVDPLLAGATISRYMFFGSVIALAVFDWGFYTLMNRAMRAKYFADDFGLHGNPMFDFQWNELKSVSTIKYFPGSTKLLIMRARKPFKFMTIGFDSDSVDEAQLLEFANRKIAEATPSS